MIVRTHRGSVDRARDAGRINVNGLEVGPAVSAAGLRSMGISFVHQDLGLTLGESVLEHVALRPERGSPWRRISWSAERRRLSEQLEDYGLALLPDQAVGALSPVERAQLAILRALDDDSTSRSRPRLLVLDEPTVFLPRHDVERLTEFIDRLRDRGDSVVLVSHDLDEVLEIADRATVLRDGRNVCTVPTAGLPRAELVTMILGADIPDVATTLRLAGEPGAVVLAVSGLSGLRARDVSLALRAGEVVGLTGLAGSGYDEVPDLLYGSRAGHVDRFELLGSPVAAARPRRMIDAGVVLVPADRKACGGAAELTVLENMALPLLPRHRRLGTLRWSSLLAAARRICVALGVKPEDPEAVFRNLSGGNQQKTIIGKWLEVEPRVLLLNEPTQGVDVGARAELLGLVRSAVDGGAAALFATSDVEQLLEVADRVLVFRAGVITAELCGTDIGRMEIAAAVYGQEERDGDHVDS